ncbi:NTP/NDP exchange transporter [Ottowia sp.]|uniref:NTP/NDP exchange transporter n=1 Tax=Ottowia sp. TaxID=1898956 RepID=UPI003A88EAFF
MKRPATSLRRWVNARPGEGQALAWSWLYMFALFLAYYVLRPIRDELGVAAGVRNLPWLFTGTLLAMLALSPLFSMAVKRWPRERFIAISYRFFMLHLLGFAVLLVWSSTAQQVWMGRAFFIWVSVFNLFVVSVFWSLVVDVFNTEQGQRLFGFLAAGATLGGMAGSALTATLAMRIDTHWLLLIAVALLEVAVRAARQLSRWQRPHAHADIKTTDAIARQQVIGGGTLAGITHTLRSPYLLGIACFILLYSITSTFLYFQQASIVDAAFASRAERTAFFARIDLWVNALTLALQVLAVGRLTQWLGVMTVLCVLPLLSVIGFSVLGMASSTGLFVAVQVARRVSNFAFAKPAREVLFTHVPREDRYKAKNFIDTVVYRSGDQIGSWTYAGLMALGLGMSGIAWVAVPLSVLWVGLSVWLGRYPSRLASPHGS